MSKAQSSLGSLKRDWSNASMAPASSSSQLIEDWKPTPPKKRKITVDSAEKSAKRILAIKEALASKHYSPTLLQSPVSRPSAQRRSRLSVPNVDPSVSSTSKPNKVAKLFLSQEQTHILNLVREGHSIFYTGSAGLFVLWCSSTIIMIGL